MGLQAGFRFYTGKGMFQWGDVRWSVVKKDTLGVGDGIVSTILGNIMPVPNLSFLVKMIAMLRFIDDFSYYTYHKPRYDSGASTFFKLCWNLTNAKWNIPQLDPLYEKFNISYSQDLPPSPTSNTPVTYLVLN